ncbi:MAG: FtsW/RodA/SpoVE family cell cycle protein [Prevotella sp.]|nr:FtsW/RodA/SpoVE family cell cycle protein [Prevotella sp.]
MAEKFLKVKIKGDGIIWAIYFILCAVSIVEVFSSSSGLTYRTGNYFKPVLSHMGFMFVGFLMLIGVMNIKCKYFKIVTPFALLFSFIMLVAVLVLGQSTNGAQRWISFLGFQFQPSELAKGALILAEAQILSAMQTPDGADRRAFKYIAYVSLPFILLIAMENLSTAMLLCITIFLMMFVGRIPKAILGKLMGGVMLVGAAGILFVMTVGTDKSTQPEDVAAQTLTLNESSKADEPQQKSKISKIFHRADTWKSRINKFLNSEEVSPDKFDIDKDAQEAHANIAIASSNIVGVGPGNSVQRDFLSQAFSDFIYAIIIEEMGVWGAAAVCLLYIILLFRTATIANRCANTFPALLIMGIALLLVIQAMFNMCVAVGLAPITGQPLPLISRGGTSTIMNCIYIGVILSVSYSAKKREELAEV